MGTLEGEFEGAAGAVVGWMKVFVGRLEGVPEGADVIGEKVGFEEGIELEGRKVGEVVGAREGAREVQH